MSYSGKGILAVLIALFLVMRLAVLFSHIDDLYEQEELYRGTIAREIIQGPKMSLWEYLDYKVECFPGGILTVGIMAVPFFLLFGQTYIALKLVGLSFAFGTFLLWYFFLKNYFGKKQALIAGLLFIFCAPFYTKSSLITWGAHPETNFFTILSIFIFFSIFLKEKEQSLDTIYRIHKARFLCLGIAAGFAMWFIHTYLLTLALIFLWWFVFDRRFILRSAFFVFCLGFFAGFSPALYYSFFHYGPVMAINGQNVLTEFIFFDLNKVPPKFFALLTVDLPRSFLFTRIGKIRGEVFSYSYYAVFLFSLGYLIFVNKSLLRKLCLRVLYPVTLKETALPDRRLFKEAFLLVFLFLFVFAYSVSNFELNPEHWLNYIGYRYMIPLMPFIFVILALFIDHIWEKKFLRNMLCVLLLGLGIFGNISLISSKTFGIYFHDKGYSYSIIGDKLGLRNKNGFKRYTSGFNRLDPVLRKQFYEGLGAGIAWRLRDASADQIMRFIDGEIADPYRVDCYRGWGMLFSPEIEEDFTRALEIAGVIPDAYKPSFYEGFGRNMNYFDDWGYLLATVKKIDPEYQQYCYKGIGYSIGFRYKNEPERKEALFNAVEVQYRPFAREGATEGENER